MKIIKYGLVAALGAFLLPAPPQSEFMVSNTGQRINLETGEVLAAAALTYSDVSNFCVRQTAVCNTAGQIWTSLENKIKYNFQRVYEWSNSPQQAQAGIPNLPPMPQQQISYPDVVKQAEPITQTSLPPNTTRPQQVSQIMRKHMPMNIAQLRSGQIITGSVSKQMANTSTTNKNTPFKLATNTLQIEDLIPEWRGPVSTGTG